MVSGSWYRPGGRVVVRENEGTTVVVFLRLQPHGPACTHRFPGELCDYAIGGWGIPRDRPLTELRHAVHLMQVRAAWPGGLSGAGAHGPGAGYVSRFTRWMSS